MFLLVAPAFPSLLGVAHDANLVPQAIKGNSLDYYLNTLHETREKNLTEFRKREDKWLATVANEGDFKANNYAKWFHVVEHESNHDGQIKFLKSRLPGAKPAAE